jgi:hypothetical protein
LNTVVPIEKELDILQKHAQRFHETYTWKYRSTRIINLAKTHQIGYDENQNAITFDMEDVIFQDSNIEDVCASHITDPEEESRLLVMTRTELLEFRFHNNQYICLKQKLSSDFQLTFMNVNDYSDDMSNFQDNYVVLGNKAVYRIQPILEKICDIPVQFADCSQLLVYLPRLERLQMYVHVFFTESFFTEVKFQVFLFQYSLNYKTSQVTELCFQNSINIIFSKFFDFITVTPSGTFWVLFDKNESQIVIKHIFELL